MRVPSAHNKSEVFDGIDVVIEHVGHQGTCDPTRLALISSPDPVHKSGRGGSPVAARARAFPAAR